ncbi:hypothetical protein Taro_012678 [Colocasia esculenta]|uniref:Uncharacterized protein n=1 Tax=Colocasia esculenta TaxID=4460 RepID=A0A843UGD7_COLES|nr:hypothetical protein [Colocasia esculenta]
MAKALKELWKSYTLARRPRRRHMQQLAPFTVSCVRWWFACGKHLETQKPVLQPQRGWCRQLAAGPAITVEQQSLDGRNKQKGPKTDANPFPPLDS